MRLILLPGCFAGTSFVLVRLARTIVLHRFLRLFLHALIFAALGPSSRRAFFHRFSQGDATRVFGPLLDRQSQAERIRRVLGLLKRFKRRASFYAFPLHHSPFCRAA